MAHKIESEKLNKNKRMRFFSLALVHLSIGSLPSHVSLLFLECQILGLYNRQKVAEHTPKSASLGEKAPKKSAGHEVKKPRQLGFVGCCQAGYKEQLFFKKKGSHDCDLMNVKSHLSEIFLFQHNLCRTT